MNAKTEQFEMLSVVNPGDECTQPHRVVLHRNLNDTQWVTHMENVEKDGKGGYQSKTHPDYYWGHYFTDLKEAMDDFNERTKKALSNL